MKKTILFFTVILLITTINMKAQNDAYYFWKSGQLISQQSIKTASCDSITYTRPLSVTICNQIWTTTNLDVSTYRDGTPIPEVRDKTAWANLTTGAWCYYNNDEIYKGVYGKLYNWYAVNDPRGLAPKGWHIPSADEWDALTNCLGNQAIAGGKMKAIDFWPSPDAGATNSSGFRGIPVGYRNGDGTFYSFGADGYWWMKKDGSTLARVLSSSNSNALILGLRPALGMTVRLIKD
jgi:uncharacterized protein (TIGR02145 family)